MSDYAIAMPAFSLLAAAARRGGWLLSGLLISALSARAEAPPPSQEFWNYMVEFGDAQGELFDPADYAVIANLPAQAPQAAEQAAESQELHAAPHAIAAPVKQEQLP